MSIHYVHVVIPSSSRIRTVAEPLTTSTALSVPVKMIKKSSVFSMTSSVRTLKKAHKGTVESGSNVNVLEVEK